MRHRQCVMHHGTQGRDAGASCDKEKPALGRRFRQREAAQWSVDVNERAALKGKRRLIHHLSAADQ